MMLAQPRGARGPASSPPQSVKRGRTT